MDPYEPPLCVNVRGDLVNVNARGAEAKKTCRKPNKNPKTETFQSLDVKLINALIDMCAKCFGFWVFFGFLQVFFGFGPPCIHIHEVPPYIDAQGAHMDPWLTSIRF